jgi:regulator of protease activity HflC (stomatin/prohibitin superfamily)
MGSGASKEGESLGGGDTKAALKARKAADKAARAEQSRRDKARAKAAKAQAKADKAQAKAEAKAHKQGRGKPSGKPRGGASESDSRLHGGGRGVDLDAQPHELRRADSQRRFMEQRRAIDDNQRLDARTGRETSPTDTVWVSGRGGGGVDLDAEIERAFDGPVDIDALASENRRWWGGCNFFVSFFFFFFF